MTSEFILQTRCFPVRIIGQNGVEDDVIVLDKTQLQAAQIVGESSKELIERMYAREGCKVLHIGKAEKREIALNLGELFRLHSVHQAGKGVGA